MVMDIALQALKCNSLRGSQYIASLLMHSNGFDTKMNLLVGNPVRVTLPAFIHLIHNINKFHI